MTRLLTAHQRVLDYLGNSLGDAGLSESDLRTDYSGRSMYGRNCVALICTLTELCRFVAALGRLHAELYVEDLTDAEQRAAEDTEEFIASLLRDVRSDSMGLDTVWYFPHVEVRP